MSGNMTIEEFDKLIYEKTLEMADVINKHLVLGEHTKKEIYTEEMIGVIRSFSAQLMQAYEDKEKDKQKYADEVFCSCVEHHETEMAEMETVCMFLWDTCADESKRNLNHVKKIVELEDKILSMQKENEELKNCHNCSIRHDCGWYIADVCRDPCDNWTRRE